MRLYVRERASVCAKERERYSVSVCARERDSVCMRESVRGLTGEALMCKLQCYRVTERENERVCMRDSKSRFRVTFRGNALATLQLSCNDCNTNVC